MTIEYDGTDYAGWQKQPGRVSTVQGVLEETLGRIVQERVSMTASGRTDKGVHAKGQVANFRTSSNLSLYRLSYAMNSLLPPAVRVMDMEAVPDDFHARYSALVREYRYFLLEKPSAINRRYAGYISKPLNLDQLNLCAGELVGKHDFSVYSRNNGAADNTFCTVYSAEWQRHGDMVVFRISASRFLRTMVRYLVSAQLEASTGELEDVLRTGKRVKKLAPADPAGLFLWRVVY
ncbi:tRNA pseudouridine(38-40) synthase TruA [Prosthecochloris sp.]|uniref:tRNA pseudouridine(38-40) synthase TruA n=1 Tax=Prosthecochloris sp. TaxID=290513 RepID=UPI0025F47C38|nr:tRNA pseudouridine(38-40) synthase TruA [Prosthecochloris sp.]